MPVPAGKEKCAQSGLPLATSDYDASWAAPGVQTAGPGPGSKKFVSPAEDATALSGKAFEMKFADCPRDPKATDALAPNTMRYSVSYELRHGFRRPSPRIYLAGSRVTLFARPRRGCCTSCSETGWRRGASPCRRIGFLVLVPTRRTRVAVRTAAFSRSSL